MAVDPNRVAQFNQQGAGGAYTPQAQAFYRMLGGTNAPGIAKSRGPAGPGLSAKMLQAAFNAYHPKQKEQPFAQGPNFFPSKKKGNSDPGAALIAAWNAYHPNPAPTHQQPFSQSPTNMFPGNPRGSQGVTGTATATAPKPPAPPSPDATAKWNYTAAANQNQQAGQSGGQWGPFASGLAKAVGAPDTPEFQDALLTIMNSEQAPDNPNARNNPLNIQAGDYPHQGTSPGGQYNFPTFGEGINQTAAFLQNNGVYRFILDAMRSGAPADSILNAWQASPWAESHYHGQLPGRLGGIRSNRDYYYGGTVRG